MYQYLLIALLCLSCQPALQVEAKPNPAPASSLPAPLGSQPASTQAPPDSYWVYIGTYSDKIYQLKLDRRTHALSHVGSFTGVQKPSFLTVHPTQRYLYAVNEVASFGTWKSGAVSAFAIDASTGALTHLNDQPSGGTGPCHLSVDPTGKFVLVANYQSGSVAVLPIKEDGSLEEPSSIVQHKGKSSNPRRQSQPHAHYIQAFNATTTELNTTGSGFDKLSLPKDGGHVKETNDQREASSSLPSGTTGSSGTLATGSSKGCGHLSVFERTNGSDGLCSPSGTTGSSSMLVVTDLGVDKIFIYQLDDALGELTKQRSVSVKAGSGPRHFAMHPTQRFAYVLNELRSNIVTYLYDATKGELSEAQTISTLPKGAGANATAEILVHPNGRFLYNSNRGHNSISMYSLDESTGALTLLGHESTQGKTPRNFNIDPSGEILIAANQSSGTLVVFEIDTNTGLLRDTGARAEVPTPVCVKFVPAK